jgi:hypothetical protein
VIIHDVPLATPQFSNAFAPNSKVLKRLSLMRMLTFAVLATFLVGLTGCGKAPNRSVADDVDLEAIQAYEAAVNAVAKQDASIDLKKQSIADEKAAAEELKKAAEESKNAAP